MGTYGVTVRKQFRGDAHQLIAWGYQDARAKLNAACEEPEITGFIVEAIENRIDYDPELDDRFLRYHVGEDPPLTGEGRSGKKRRRADIRMLAQGLRPRPRYVFEAKRLKHGSHGIADYLGQEGLRRFIDDTSYSRDATEAAMLGFVQSSSVADWIAKLEKRVPEDDELRVKSPLLPFDSDGCFECCYAAEHERFDGKQIEICQILLDCT